VLFALDRFLYPVALAEQTLGLLIELDRQPLDTQPMEQDYSKLSQLPPETQESQHLDPEGSIRQVKLEMLPNLETPQ
jgi:hypothetical protein